MPEGPSIMILKNAVQAFTGKKVLEATGSTKKIDPEQFLHKKVLAFKTWGKHFLVCFKDCTLRVHFMLFGSYLINEQKAAKPALSLRFTNGEINFYSCSLKIITEPLDDVYDWTADTLSDEWDAKKAKKKLKQHPDMLVCDAILDQDIFAGAGNIFKNEVLYRIKVHPLSKLGALPDNVLTKLVKEVRNYAFDFLKWKQEGVLKKNWKVHTKKTCPDNGGPVVKEYLGKTHRRTYYCPDVQVLYE